MKTLYFSEVKTSTASSSPNIENVIEKRLSDLLPEFGVDLNIIENSDEDGLKLAFNIR